MKNYEDLQRLITEGDPIWDPEDPKQGKPILSEEGLFIPGINDSSQYGDDLLIKIEDNKYYLSTREPGAKEWFQTTVHETFESLHNWIYEL